MGEEVQLTAFNAESESRLAVDAGKRVEINRAPLEAAGEKDPEEVRFVGHNSPTTSEGSDFPVIPAISALLLRIPPIGAFFARFHTLY